MRISETDKAYIAGIMDGEGDIALFPSYPRGKKYLSVRIGISNTSLDLLLWIQSLYGGKIADRTEESVSPTTKRHGRKPFYRWNLHGQARIERFLHDINPYLKIKHLRAKVALDFCHYRNRFKKARGKERPYDEKDWSFEQKMNAVKEAERVVQRRFLL